MDHTAFSKIKRVLIGTVEVNDSFEIRDMLGGKLGFVDHEFTFEAVRARLLNGDYQLVIICEKLVKDLSDNECSAFIKELSEKAICISLHLTPEGDLRMTSSGVIMSFSLPLDYFTFALRVDRAYNKQAEWKSVSESMETLSKGMEGAVNRILPRVEATLVLLRAMERECMDSSRKKQIQLSIQEMTQTSALLGKMKMLAITAAIIVLLGIGFFRNQELVEQSVQKAIGNRNVNTECSVESCEK